MKEEFGQTIDQIRSLLQQVNSQPDGSINSVPPVNVLVSLFTSFDLMIGCFQAGLLEFTSGVSRHTTPPAP